MTTVAAELDRRYPGAGRQAKLRLELAKICARFTQSGLADPDFESEFSSGVDAKFWSRLSEALIHSRLLDNGLTAAPTPKGGPDFLILDGAHRIWIEVVCPEPVGLSDDWLTAPANVAGSVPHDAILLRWTSAIRDKTLKLLGDPAQRKQGYLRADVVRADDSYVIAVNGCQLRHGPFPGIRGISQFPYAAEAVFPIGPWQIHFDRETLKVVGRGHQHRLEVAKANGGAVSTAAFMDPANAAISAIWGVDFKGHGAVGIHEPSALIHNPLAAAPVARGLLPADQEYEAVAEEDGYLFGPVQRAA